MNTPHDNSTSLDNKAQCQGSLAGGERGALAPAAEMPVADGPRLVTREHGGKVRGMKSYVMTEKAILSLPEITVFN